MKMKIGTEWSEKKRGRNGGGRRKEKGNHDEMGGKTDMDMSMDMDVGDAPLMMIACVALMSYNHRDRNAGERHMS